jgi:hypothetical protein
MADGLMELKVQLYQRQQGGRQQRVLHCPKCTPKYEYNDNEAIPEPFSFSKGTVSSPVAESCAGG